MVKKFPKPKRQFGVKDPLKQRAEREEKIKDKINNPPKNIDDQEVSNKFKKFVKVKNDAKSGKSIEKLKTYNADFKSSEIDMDKMTKRSNETDRKFIKRVDRIVYQRKVEAQFAAKYNVDITRNQDTGEIKLKKRKKDETDKIDELMKKKREELKRGKKRQFKKQEDDEPQDEPEKLTSLQKMKLKKMEKLKVKKHEKDLAFAEYQHEDIKFGETVLAPPSLLTLPRKAVKTDSVPRPGKRNLLLTSIMNPNDEKPEEPVRPKVTFNKLKVHKGPIDKKGKRKNLPNSTRVALETERQRAVDLYRQSKKKTKTFVRVPKKNLDDFE